MCKAKIKKRKCYEKQKIGSGGVHGDMEKKTEQRGSRCKSAEGLKVHWYKALEFRPFYLSVVYAPCPFLSSSAVFPGFLCAALLKVSGELPKTAF